MELRHLDFKYEIKEKILYNINYNLSSSINYKNFNNDSETLFELLNLEVCLLDSYISDFLNKPYFLKSNIEKSRNYFQGITNYFNENDDFVKFILKSNFFNNNCLVKFEINSYSYDQNRLFNLYDELIKSEVIDTFFEKEKINKINSFKKYFLDKNKEYDFLIKL